MRDLTPVRDEDGRVVQLPHLERMFAEALAAIRQFQMKRPPQKRLYWNRILLYVWPTLDLNADELQDIAIGLRRRPMVWDWSRWCVRARIPHPRDRRIARHADAHLESRQLPGC